MSKLLFFKNQVYCQGQAQAQGLFLLNLVIPPSLHLLTIKTFLNPPLTPSNNVLLHMTVQVLIRLKEGMNNELSVPSFKTNTGAISLGRIMQIESLNALTRLRSTVFSLVIF